MTDIQARVADINRRAKAAQAARDRQFWSIIAYIWIVAIGAVIAAYSLPRADFVFHQQILAEQENVRHG
ncbi:hypothetical protein A6U86_05650 [Rhizobium sp. AC27/96]|uniref:hypothetical protein n=1 Tax=Rhizobium sp. AC27/96 TaxID=1841653 RepID=UPI000827F611|nr:hypothetical protein [Rhizobium sp. AC27/96]OCJ12507.1 hypothetical protein A6U86_05650 [Rhizobium sp. AC27/96]